MTDVKRHSIGYWRSLFVFAPYDEQWKARDAISAKLEEMDVEYSYCHYGEIEDEAPHITFRINFPDMKTMEKFYDFMKSTQFKWEDHNYDEPLWVKKAYVLGTMLARAVVETTQHPDVPLSRDFMRLMFHGYFNDIHYNYKEEANFYFAAFSELLKYLGLKSN